MTDNAQNNYPLISVIIPVYNGEKYISETLESVIAQTEKNWEIIAINDGSTDTSQTILENYLKKIPGRLQVISVENGGVSRARNIGVSAARGIYIAFLDQDDLWAPEKLQCQINMFFTNKSLGIAFTNESIIDQQGSIIREKALKFDKKNRGNIFDHLIFDNFIPISSVILEKKLFMAIGGFDPQFSLAEDYDFLLKVTQKVPVDFIDEPLLLYREHGESSTFQKIDRIMAESFTILRSWKVKKPQFFRKHFLKYQLFCLKFVILKIKVRIRQLFT